MSDDTIWEDSPSQFTNLKIYIIAGLIFFWTFYMAMFGQQNLGLPEVFGKYLVFGLLLVPPCVFLYNWLTTEFTSYSITPERLFIRSGILSKSTDVLELYRVRDFVFEQPVMLRIFSLGNLILESSDRTHPTVVLSGVPDGEALMNMLRTHVEACRVDKNVREVDFE